MSYFIIENILIIVAIFGLLTSILLSFRLSRFSYIINLFSLFIIFLLLIIRVLISGHPPYTNIYETLLFFSFIYSFKVTILSKYPIRVKGILNILTIIILISVFFSPIQQKEINPLNSFLNSIWLNIHVPSFFIGYLSIFSSFLLLFLDIFKIYSNENYTFEMKTAIIFVTIGLISGSIWAKEAWGSYWDWDPKEIGALVIWLLSILFLIPKNKKARFIISILIILSLLITYIGLSFFVSGYHSYK